MHENHKDQTTLRAHDIDPPTTTMTTPLPLVCPNCTATLMGHWTPRRTRCRLIFCQSCPWFFNLDAYMLTITSPHGILPTDELLYLKRQLDDILIRHQPEHGLQKPKPEGESTES